MNLLIFEPVLSPLHNIQSQKGCAEDNIQSVNGSRRIVKPLRNFPFLAKTQTPYLHHTPYSSAALLSPTLKAYLSLRSRYTTLLSSCASFTAF